VDGGKGKAPGARSGSEVGQAPRLTRASNTPSSVRPQRTPLLRDCGRGSPSLHKTPRAAKACAPQRSPCLSAPYIVARTMGNVFSRELPQNPARQAVPARPTPEMGFAGAGVTLGGIRANASTHTIANARSSPPAEPSLVHTSRTTAAPLSSAATTMDAVPRAIAVTIPEPREDAKHVVIVGGGAAGLIMLKTIMGTPQYTRGDWTVTLLEAREDIGGVWYAFRYQSARARCLHRFFSKAAKHAGRVPACHSAVRLDSDERRAPVHVAP
jgi:hypothetical protein